MTLYDVELNYQNFGSGWLIVLRGATDKIETAFNAFFNWGATNGRLTYQDGVKTTATFWSTRQRMEKFFATQLWVRNNTDEKEEASKVHVAANIAELEQNHESFLKFTDGVTDFFTSGQIKAERPDTDAKDAIILNAFKSKDDSRPSEDSES